MAKLQAYQTALASQALMVGNSNGEGSPLPVGSNFSGFRVINGVTSWVPPYTAGTAPTANHDNVDTAGAGRRFGIGDFYVDSVGTSIYFCVNNATGAAVWQKMFTGTAFTPGGNVDASNTPTDLTTLNANAIEGQVFRVNVTGGTENFNGTFDAVANAGSTGVTFEVGDQIVKRGAGFDKWDQTDPSAVTTFRRLYFTEAGPVVPESASYAMTTTLPANLQDGNKNSVQVFLNGKLVSMSAVSLTGIGPYVINLNMAVEGYTLTSAYEITVSYNAP